MPAQRITEADFQVSDDDWDELASESESSENNKPSGEALKTLKGQLQEPRFKTVNLRQLHGRSSCRMSSSREIVLSACILEGENAWREGRVGDIHSPVATRPHAY
jgi:hypothetical protein